MPFLAILSGVFFAFAMYVVKLQTYYFNLVVKQPICYANRNIEIPPDTNGFKGINIIIVAIKFLRSLKKILPKHQADRKKHFKMVFSPLLTKQPGYICVSKYLQAHQSRS